MKYYIINGSITLSERRFYAYAYSKTKQSDAWTSMEVGAAYFSSVESAESTIRGVFGERLIGHVAIMNEDELMIESILYS